jgi:Xaa-Pro aminopeptidase
MNRLNKFFEIIDKNNIDAFLVTGIPNIRYISNFTGEEGFLLGLNKEAYLIVDSRFTDQAKNEVAKNIIVLEYKGSISLFLQQMLLTKKAHWLGIEKSRINYSLYSSLELIPFLKIVPTTDLIEGMRIIKDKKEIAIMKRAFELSKKSFNETLPLIKEGISEKDIATELEYRFRKNGGEKPAFDTIVASGMRGAFPHGVASGKKIKAHEPIVMDFGLFYEGYATDTTRTIVIGKPEAEFKRIYEIIKDAQALGRNVVKSVVKASDVDKIVRNFIKEKGFGDYFTHGLGHGVGLEIHENPSINESSTFTLEENMVITIEPGVYLQGKFGIRIEDTILVTKEEHINLTDITHDLITL